MNYSKKSPGKKVKEEKPNLIRKISSKLFLSYVNKVKSNYKNFEKDFYYSRINVLFEVYLATIIFLSVLSWIVSWIVILIILFLLKYPILPSIFFGLFVSLGVAGIVFIIQYLYPRIKSDSRKQNINSNLPFAIIYLSGTAQSGVPPQNMFKLLANAEGFGEIGVEAKYLVYLMQKRNYGLLNAIDAIASKTPSQEFKEFLLSLSITLKYGGDVERFLKDEANRKEIDYKLKGREYQEKLSMFSTMYTSLFIAAPVLFITMYSLMNFFSPIGGTSMLHEIILFGLPLINVMYLFYIHSTQPG